MREEDEMMHWTINAPSQTILICLSAQNSLVANELARHEKSTGAMAAQ